MAPEQTIFHYKDINLLLDKLDRSKQIIATNGCFDVLHIGHLRYLQESKNILDNTILIVGLNSDRSVKELKGESRPLNHENDRAELLLGLKPVDYVVIFDDLRASNFLAKIKPNIYTKGGDYDIHNYDKCPEFKIIKDLGSKIALINFVEGYSSTKLIDAI